MPLPVVLLHGARTSGTMWRAQLEALERAGRQAVAPDLPGHGRRVQETFTVDGALEAVGEAVDRVGGRAVVVGLSLGGYLAAAWAARHPEGTAALLLSGCSTDPDTVLTGAWLQAARVIGHLPDRGAALNQTLVERALPPEGAADAAAGGFALDVMVDLLDAMRALDPRADLQRFTGPVWFANGQWDHFRLHERRFLAARPGARRVVVRGATHLTSLVRPVAFTRVLLELLEEVDPPAVRAAGRQPAGRLAVSPGR
ncbi:MAG: alpha/beta fold hydrolase [Actinotalea sp.]|nr:alpha/beta fold hydrolase [Actinotalea sp.]